MQNIGRAVAADNCKREINWDRAALLMLCRRSFPSLLGSDCMGFIHLTACNKKHKERSIASQQPGHSSALFLSGDISPSLTFSSQQTEALIMEKNNHN